MHSAGMIYGYARLSTDMQEPNNQVAQPNAGRSAAIFSEKISGATPERSRLKRLMAKLNAGDVVVITAVDRRSRDTTDHLEN
jgi:DNA invertase Pin-like site-specific DNA recombinase